MPVCRTAQLSQIATSPVLHRNRQTLHTLVGPGAPDRQLPWLPPDGSSLILRCRATRETRCRAVKIHVTPARALSVATIPAPTADWLSPIAADFTQSITAITARLTAPSEGGARSPSSPTRRGGVWCGSDRSNHLARLPSVPLHVVRLFGCAMLGRVDTSACKTFTRYICLLLCCRHGRFCRGTRLFEVAPFYPSHEVGGWWSGATSGCGQPSSRPEHRVPRR